MAPPTKIWQERRHKQSACDDEQIRDGPKQRTKQVRTQGNGRRRDRIIQNPENKMPTMVEQRRTTHQTGMVYVQRNSHAGGGEVGDHTLHACRFNAQHRWERLLENVGGQVAEFQTGFLVGWMGARGAKIPAKPVECMPLPLLTTSVATREAARIDLRIHSLPSHVENRGILPRPAQY